MNEVKYLALIEAERQTRLSRKRFPPVCPWSFDQAITGDFWPERCLTAA